MNDISTENYYYVQAFKKEEHAVAHTVCFADDKASALAASRKWANEKGFDGSIHLYHKNYKRDSRIMVEQGNFIRA